MRGDGMAGGGVADGGGLVGGDELVVEAEWISSHREFNWLTVRLLLV